MTAETPLAAILARRIAAAGPLTLADYMAECLLHPEHGYYTTREAIGAAGDFTTAPEISQMFGELVALWLGQCWADQGAPAPFALAELGPGRGTLMADILRTIARVPGMAAAARVHLVETSPRMRALQRAALAGTNAAGHGVTWHDSAATLPDEPLFLVANEFFDALPIRQFVRAEGGWAERMVGLSPDRDGAHRLAFGLAPPLPVAALAHRLADTAPGDIVELCPALLPIAEGIARRIAARGGAALVIDYGGWRSRGDTLQAVRAHAYADPLAAPGQADLTAHVDFAALAAAFRTGGCTVSAMTPQGIFLDRLGIGARSDALAARLSGEALLRHRAAQRRLTHPAEMGEVFRVLACLPAGAPPPPALDPPPPASPFQGPA